MNELKRKWVGFQSTLNPSTVRKVFALLVLILAYIRLSGADPKDAWFIVVLGVIAAVLAHEATKMIVMIILILGAVGSVLFPVYAAFKASPIQAGIVIFGLLVAYSLFYEK